MKSKFLPPQYHDLSQAQKLEPNTEHPGEFLRLILDVIQFNRWRQYGYGYWEEKVLKNLIKHFGEEIFLNVCIALSIWQHINFQTWDTGGLAPTVFLRSIMIFVPMIKNT